MITVYVWEKKLGDPSRSMKTYWATLRALWNGKKIPNIPLLLVNNKLSLKLRLTYLINISSASALQSIIITYFLPLGII